MKIVCATSSIDFIAVESGASKTVVCSFIQNPAHYEKTLSKSIISEEDRELASHIIVRALGDHTLPVVRTVIGYLRAMMERLDACYDPQVYVEPSIEDVRSGFDLTHFHSR